MIPRKLLIGLLAFGTVAGFGSGIASAARAFHHRRHGCHAESWKHSDAHHSTHWSSVREGPSAMGVAPTPAPSPAAAAMPSPAAAALPSQWVAPQQVQAAAPGMTYVLVPSAGPAPSPATTYVVASPSGAAGLQLAQQTGAAAGNQALQLPAIHVNVTLPPQAQADARAPANAQPPAVNPTSPAGP